MSQRGAMPNAIVGRTATTLRRLPAKPVRSLIMCEQCNQGRRTAVEMIDPKTEEPMLLCERCAGRAALGYAFKRQVPWVRRVHADDAGNGDGGVEERRVNTHTGHNSRGRHSVWFARVELFAEAPAELSGDADEEAAD